MIYPFGTNKLNKPGNQSWVQRNITKKLNFRGGRMWTPFLHKNINEQTIDGHTQTNLFLSEEVSKEVLRDQKR